jgi:cobalt-zinc-cadmium efflux system membrane fusion protein
VRSSLALVVALLALFAWAGPGHDHGEQSATPSASALDVELNLKITDPQGNPVSGVNDQVKVSLKEGEEIFRDATSHAEEDPGVFHLDHSFEHEGKYLAEWSVPANGKNLTAAFEVVVGHEEEKAATGVSLPLLIGGGALALILAFFIGRSSGRGKAAGAAVMCFALMLSSTPLALGQDEHGHDHGSESGLTDEPLQIGIGRVGVMSASKTIDGYTMTFTIIVIPPDPNLVRITDEQRELLGLKTEAVGRGAFGKGVRATGQVQADPSRIANISAPAAGRLEQVSANLGDRVKKGQVLAIVLAPEAAGAQAEVAAAQAIVYQAQANRQRAVRALELARQSLARQEEFARTGAFSQPSLQAARTEVAAAQSELAESQSAIRQAKAEQATHARELERIKQLYDSKLASRREVEAAELEASLDAERVQQAVARVTQADSRVKNARETLTREERIQEEGLYNRREIETAKAEVRRAEGELNAAETELKGAQATVQAARGRVGAYGGSGRIALTAPIDGTVTTRKVNRGESVEQGRNLFTILDTSEVWVQADLFESDLARVEVGMQVEVKMDGSERDILFGKVAQVGKVVDPEKRTAPVRIRVSNREAQLRQNEFAQILLLTDEESSVLSVPESAIQEIGGLPVVFVETSTGFVRRSVTLGPSANRRRQVSSGIEPGERVATQGSYQLRMMATAQ